MRCTSMTLWCANSVVMLVTACGEPDRVTAVVPQATPSLDVGTPPPPTYVGYALTDISAGLASRATDINAHGWIVGTHTMHGSEHGFLRHPDGTVEDVPPLTGDVSNVVTGINDSEQIVGTSTAPNGTTHAWTRALGGSMARLYDAGCALASHANAIDDAGNIVGGCGGVPAQWGPRYGPPWFVVGGTGDLFDIAVGTPVGTVDEPVSTTAALVGGPNGATTLAMPYGTVHARINGIDGSRVMVGGYTVGTTERGFWATLSATHQLPHVVYGISGQGRLVGWYTSIPAVAYTIAPNAFVETPLPPTNADRVAVRVNRCGSIVGHYFPSGLQGGPRAALWTKPSCD